MNANAFRHLYKYHFSENHKIWEHALTLTEEQFTQPVPYSIGSVRDQIVHLIGADDYWFSGLRGLVMPEPFDPASFPDRPAIRAQWDQIEQGMRDYLDTLQDGMLFERPFPDGEDRILIRWQVLLHVANHGTDHRAQILRLLHDLGADTGPQDYIFYIFEHH